MMDEAGPTLKTWLKRWALAIGLVVVVLVLGGLLLPRQFAVERKVEVQAAPELVFSLVADPRRWKDWTEWNRRDPSMQISYSGAASGAGAGWAWKSESEGEGSMRFTAAEPPRRLAYELSFPEWDSTSRGEFLLQPQGKGTQLRWRLEGDLGFNPVARWMGLLADRMIGKDFDLGLMKLKMVAEQG